MLLRLFVPGRHAAVKAATALSARACALVFSSILVGGLFVVVLLAALGPATATPPPAAGSVSSACHRADTAAWALVDAGEKWLHDRSSIDPSVLQDPQLRRLYAAAQREHLACRDEVARQATGPRR